jgi:hypothetical protein
MRTIQHLHGRPGAKDHDLGGRYVRRGRARGPRRLAFPLSDGTVHLFELITPSQLREPVPARRIFPSFSTRYDLTALLFAQQVEKQGGRNYNAESRPSAEADREYAGLQAAALDADLAFFKRPAWDRYLAVAAAEERFGALRESLIEENLGHFASEGNDVVARLGRLHSRVRRLGRRGFVVRTRIGAGPFFPEQILKRRAIFGLRTEEEDRMRGYVDRFLRIVPSWRPGFELPSRERLLALAGRELAAVHERFDALARSSRTLPELRDLLDILRKAAENGGAA